MFVWQSEGIVADLARMGDAFVGADAFSFIAVPALVTLHNLCLQLVPVWLLHANTLKARVDLSWLPEVREQHVISIVGVRQFSHPSVLLDEGVPLEISFTTIHIIFVIVTNLNLVWIGFLIWGDEETDDSSRNHSLLLQIVHKRVMELSVVGMGGQRSQPKDTLLFRLQTKLFVDGIELHGFDTEILLVWILCVF